jgi:hypothetical protein
MDKKITEYQVIRTKFDEFDDEMRRQLKRGWQPHGEPFIFAFHFGMGLAQALVKYEEVEEEVISHVIEACEILLEKIETAMPQLKNSVWEAPKIEEEVKE